MCIRSCFLSTVLLASISNISLASPIIKSTDGTIAHNSLLVISGSNFTPKTNAAPLLYWNADGGESPSSLGRKTAWDGTFNGTFVNAGDHGAQTAKGSTQSVQLDHSLSESAILRFSLFFIRPRLYMEKEIR